MLYFVCMFNASLHPKVKAELEEETRLELVSGSVDVFSSSFLEYPQIFATLFSLMGESYYRSAAGRNA